MVFRSYRTRVKRSRLMGSRRPRRPRRVMRRKPMTTGRVKRIIDAELKVRDLSVAPLPIAAVTGQIQLLSNILQGDTNSDRTGNWIKPTSLMGTITIQGNEAADPSVISLIRVGIVCWKENETLNPFTIAQIMQDPADPH